MLERHFSWQAQHLVKFWEIAGARNIFPHKMRLQDGTSNPNGRVRDDEFMVGSWSDRGSQ